MKKFLTESALFLILIFISFFLVFLKADGYTDPFYLRFTTPRQHSLILGSSRAAQGIQPAVLNEVLSRTDFFNYCFTLTTNPYGPAYLESVRKKLHPDTKDGIFILAVDPWSISTNRKDPNDSTKFPEIKSMIGKTRYVNIYPNIPYLWDSYNKPFYYILNPAKSSMFLHQDGWLEVNTNMSAVALGKNLEKKLSDYRKDNLPVFHFSEVRLKYLIHTIEFLKSHGKVFLVRLPVHKQIRELDEELMPDFNEKIMLVSETTNTPYFDMTSYNDQTIFTDGLHIYKESGVMISREIGKWILSFQ